MKRKLVFLPLTYSKEVVDIINSYFDKGYEIEDVLYAEEGYYILLILKDDGNYSYKYVSKIYPSDSSANLIEENKNPIPTWVKTSTKEILFN